MIVVAMHTSLPPPRHIGTLFEARKPAGLGRLAALSLRAGRYRRAAANCQMVRHGTGRCPLTVAHVEAPVSCGA